FLRNGRRVRRTWIELDVLLAEESEVRDMRGRTGMQHDVRIDVQRDLGLAIRTQLDVRDFARANTRNAHGGFVVESRYGVAHRGDLSRARSVTDLHIFDLQDEIPEDRQGDQHENADFCRG